MHKRWRANDRAKYGICRGRSVANKKPPSCGAAWLITELGQLRSCGSRQLRVAAGDEAPLRLALAEPGALELVKFAQAILQILRVQIAEFRRCNSGVIASCSRRSAARQSSASHLFFTGRPRILFMPRSLPGPGAAKVIQSLALLSGSTYFKSAMICAAIKFASP